MEKTIVIIGGTRPDIIKLAPVFHAFKDASAKVEFWQTGQHLALADSPANFFEVVTTLRWRSLKSGQNGNQLLSKLIERLSEGMRTRKPSAVLVQGDTTTALAGALAAFHLGIPVGHIEAGLRTGNLAMPFPEEMNRRVIDSFAKWLFPPTAEARKNLIREGQTHCGPSVGNTGVDALYWARDKVMQGQLWPLGVQKPDANHRMILSTGHRRENLGAPLVDVLKTLKAFVKASDHCYLVHISHPNPKAKQIAQKILRNSERVVVLDPVDYPRFIALMNQASVIVSDSGGIQEEAAALGVPILITREVTERPEVLKCGGELVGQDSEKLKTRLRAILSAPYHGLKNRTRRNNPFGDGFASKRIATKILSDL